MARLRLTQGAALEGARFPVTITWTDDDGDSDTVEGLSAAVINDQTQTDLRWYFEEALAQCAYDPPAKERAKRVEETMAELGRTLFCDFFEANTRARNLFAKVRDRIKDTRIEISTTVAETASIPWELLRDSETQQPLLQTAPAFVRVPKMGTVEPNKIRLKEDEPLRVLLAICRPGGADDVSFRSVARQLVKGLGGSKTVDLTVLRPPTFERLAQVLGLAKTAGKPFHLLHFDGHGSYAPTSGAGHATPGMEQYRGGAPRGTLSFEDPKAAGNRRAVDGCALGALLNDNGVAALVLNACQSADAGDAKNAADPNTPMTDQVRAQGSLAQEAIEAGVGAVLAMRYSVYVVTAAQFVGRFYELVAAGRSFGVAASEARKALLANPMRDFDGTQVEFQDWSVPVVFEANPTPLLPARRQAETAFALDAPTKGDGLPASPEIGFIGRDGELLRLDRAFDPPKVDTQNANLNNIVLLHAYAGSGKTATAAEFARWYAATGGIYDEVKRTNGKIWFDSFERHLPLARLLDRVEQSFGEGMQQQGINWLALDTAGRVDIALQILKQIPVLWIWDNVETVAGFPTGAPSAWDTAEQAELKDFLSALRGTKAKVLLTSRRDEQKWLGDLPARIDVRPMPMAERRAMAAELASRNGQGPGVVAGLGPLLDWSQGNPMTLIVVVRQALREKRLTPGLIDDYVAKLRAGAAVFDDDVKEGRSKSLGASLAYGYETFSGEERALLSLLHFFQGLADADVLKWMGVEGNPGRAAPYAGLTREDWIALLLRAAEIGLITHLGDEYFTVHPALPWFLQREFDRAFPDPAAPRRAWVNAMAELSDCWANRAIDGERGALPCLQELEANLLAARTVAVREGWTTDAVSLMQGLREVYEPSGRWAAWGALVAGVVPLVEDAAGDPLPGREENWSQVIRYRVILADAARDSAAAIALLEKCAVVGRRRDGGLTNGDAKTLTDDQRNAVRSLAATLLQLGISQMQTGDPACRKALTEAKAACHHAGLRREEAITAFCLGQAYMTVAAIRDLTKAENATRESLSLRDKDDAADRAGCHIQLGQVAWQRFGDAREQTQPAPWPARLWARLRRRPAEANTLHALLQTALNEYLTALELAPDDAGGDRAVTLNALGIIFQAAGLIDAAAANFRQAIHDCEACGNPYGAAQYRWNLANLYRLIEKFPDAKDYAEAALKGFEAFDTNAADMIAKTQHLLKLIAARDVTP